MSYARSTPALRLAQDKGASSATSLTFRSVPVRTFDTSDVVTPRHNKRPMCSYIWMGHRDPKNVDMWKLAARGTALWEQEAADMGECAPTAMPPAWYQTPPPPPSRHLCSHFRHQSLCTYTSSACSLPQVCRAGGMSFHPQGSLIISSDAETAYMLEQRAADLAAEGIEAAMVTPAQCAELEPLLNVPRSGAGLRVAADFQLDARGATSYLLRCCERLGGLGSPGGPGGRFRMHFGCSVHHISVDCCSGAFATVATSSGDVRAMCAMHALHTPTHPTLAVPRQSRRPCQESVQCTPRRNTACTSRSALNCRKGAVIAMGCASAQVMVDSFYDQLYTQLLRKRWGLLLEVPYPEGAPRLRHGTMDVSYMGHTGAVAQQGAQAAPPPVLSLTEDTEEVSFTAATSSRGTLLLGAVRCSGMHARDAQAGAPGTGRAPYLDPPDMQTGAAAASTPSEAGEVASARSNQSRCMHASWNSTGAFPACRTATVCSRR